MVNGWPARWRVLALALVVATGAATAVALGLHDGDRFVPVAWPTAPLGALALLAVPRLVAGRALTVLGLALATAAGALAVAAPTEQAVALGLGTALGSLALVLVLDAARGGERPFGFEGIEDAVRLGAAAAVGALVTSAVVAVVLAAWPDPGLGLGLGTLDALDDIGAASVVAVLVLVPPALCYPGRHDHGGASAEETALQVLTLLGAVVLVFWPTQTLPVTFSFLVVLAWGALRIGGFAVTLEVALIGVAAAVANVEGWGAIGNAVDAGRLAADRGVLLSQALATAAAVLALPLALGARQRRELLAQLASDEQRYRRNFTRSSVGQLQLSRRGDTLVIADLNAAAQQLLGGTPEQLVGTRLEQHLTGRALTSAIQAAVQGRAEEQRVQADRSGRPGRVDVALSRVSGPGEAELFAAQLLDVSLEYDARRRLEDAEKLTSATLDTTACIILVTDLDGRIVRVNAATTDITGYAPSELLGRPIATTTLAPGDPADVEALFLWPNRSGAPVTRESDVVTRDGRRRRVVWTANMVRDDLGLPAYAVMTGIDVTSERAAAGVVSHLLGASITTALVGVDASGLVTVFNSGAQRLLDYEPADTIGHPFTGLFDPVQLRERTGTDDPVAAFEALVAPVREHGELERRDWTWLDRSGTPYEVSMSLSLAEPASGTGGGSFLCVAQDVTEQRRSQDLLLAALEKERTALERLKSIDDAKNDFVSTVSHELRTPVTSILGYTEMLLDGTVGEPMEDQAPLLATIRRNGQRLIDLCNDLLTLSRLDAGTATWTAERLDLAQLLRGVGDTMHPMISGRDLIFDLELPDAPVVVAGDSSQLERVFINLVSNAVKFTEDGGLVRISLVLDGDEAVVKVRDTGIGIPAEEQDQLFQRFFRSTTAQRQAIQGTGLGLSIVAAIVEAHGGSVRVRSAHQEGSTFTVTLPLARR